MRKDYGTRNKMMGGGMMKKRTMMKKGGLKMVSKNGKKVPFFAADGKGAKDLGKAKMMKGSKPDFLDLDKDNNKTESMKSAAASAKKMMKGGRVKKMGGGMSKLNPGLRKFMMAKKKAK